MSTSELAERLAMSAPVISRHLAILELAELVTSERKGRCVLYQLNADSLASSLTGYALELCPLARPLKRESRAIAKSRKAQ